MRLWCLIYFSYRYLKAKPAVWDSLPEEYEEKNMLMSSTKKSYEVVLLQERQPPPQAVSLSSPVAIAPTVSPDVSSMINTVTESLWLRVRWFLFSPETATGFTLHSNHRAWPSCHNKGLTVIRSCVRLDITLSKWSSSVICVKRHNNIRLCDCKYIFINIYIYCTCGSSGLCDYKVKEEGCLIWPWEGCALWGVNAWMCSCEAM